MPPQIEVSVLVGCGTRQKWNTSGRSRLFAATLKTSELFVVVEISVADERILTELSLVIEPFTGPAAAAGVPIVPVGTGMVCSIPSTTTTQIAGRNSSGPMVVNVPV